MFGANKMELKGEITINALLEKVWQVAAEQYDQIGVWASDVAHSEANPDLPKGEGRVCHAPGFGDVKETIIRYDEQERSFAYSATGLPFFVRYIENNWRLEARGEQTIVNIHAKGRLMPIIGLVMGPILKRQFTRAGEEALEELKYYVEIGTVHPRKAAALAKIAGQEEQEALNDESNSSPGRGETGYKPVESSR